jgi:hypothetical protein
MVASEVAQLNIDDYGSVIPAKDRELLISTDKGSIIQI